VALDNPLPTTTILETPETFALRRTADGVEAGGSWTGDSGFLVSPLSTAEIGLRFDVPPDFAPAT